LKNSNYFKKVQTRANFDKLTNVFNRHSLEESISTAYKIAKTNGEDLCAVMLDIDNFKRLNDTYGHPFGDIVLNGVAQCVKNTIRATDVVGRYGGEEFVVLFAKADIKDGVLAAEKIRENVANLKFESEQGIVRVQISLGVSSVDCADVELSLVGNADKALYVAKQTGKNKVVAYIPSMSNVDKGKK